ncbi:MAG TPA: CHAD domain-containing protein [Nocardioidaceae bacterium]|nr:CHAD domain-containing protein [Nocardioidaceae bacterium]
MPDHPVTATPGPAPGSRLADLLEDQILEVQAALLELGRDPESMVHDARVALRKLRSSLSLFSPLLVTSAARSLRRELTWLSGELGPARDAQVMLGRMTSTVEAAHPEGVEGDEVIAVFQQRHDEAFASAREALASERFTALLGRLDIARLRSLVASEAPFEQLAGQDLKRLLRDLEASADSSDVRLHELRKAVKKARYVRRVHDDVDAALKRVQAVLGEHQDSVVARQRLSELPETAFVDSLVAREDEAAEASEGQLKQAIRKLRKAISQADAPYT